MPSSNASSKLLTAVSASVILVVVTNALVVKRSDDNLPDIAVVERHSTEIEQLKASLAALQNSIAETNAKIADTNANVGRLDTNVAFLAFFREGDVGGYHKGMTIKYNAVRYNAGNGYDPVTGLFTAPASGLYAFGIKIQAQAGKSEALDLVHEGQRFGHIFGDDPSSYDMVSTLELLHVNKGERVWVVTEHDNHFQGSWISHFLGFLLHAD